MVAFLCPSTPKRLQAILKSKGLKESSHPSATMTETFINKGGLLEDQVIAGHE